MAIEKNQNPGGCFVEVNGLNWQCCLAGSSKTTPRILIFSIAIDANYSYEVKNSEIWEPAFFKHNNSFIATVFWQSPCSYCLTKVKESLCMVCPMLVEFQFRLLVRGHSIITWTR